MNFQLPRNPLGPLLTHPGLNLMRIAAGATLGDGEVDLETLALMRRQVGEAALEDLDPALLWPEFARGLMGAQPSRMLWVLRECGALRRMLPEVDALFGMPQSADDPPTVDIGEHQFRVVDEVARSQGGLPLRFAALVFNVGKFDSPPEHLPAHYRHMERALPRIQQICARFRLPDAHQALAILAMLELERVHRAAEMRAGSIAALLERVDALGQPHRFADLLTLCAADYRAYPGRGGRSYPKERLLLTALEACRQVRAEDLALPDGDEDSQARAEGLQEARALAVARALRSARWGEDEPA